MIETKFKQTEIGLIPEDWEIIPLRDVAENYTGLTYSPNDVHPYGTLVLRSSNIQDSQLCFDDNVYVIMDIPQRAIVRNEDILVCVRNGSQHLIGKSAKITPEADGMAFGAFMTILRPKNIDGNFLLYVWRSRIIQKQIEEVLGATINQITNADLKSFIVLCPSSREQKSIAEALSNINQLISSLSKTIEKKRLIKQGAMQQLLTGKKRLPGFDEDWKEKNLGEIGITYNGIVGKTKDDFGKGNAKYITFLNILNNPIVDIAVLEKVNILPNEGQFEAQLGDLFFNTSSETPEEVGICSYLNNSVTNVYLNSFCFGYRLIDKSVLGLYLSYFFRSEQGRTIMCSLAQGSTRYNLSKDSFRKISIVVPSTIQEQTAIVEILTTMDDEIESLEEERDKYIRLKEGMMQKLLTGQIRLVDTSY